MDTLYVVATPIGNLEDITIRAIKTLLSVPVIACEDTRRTGQLVKLLKDRYRPGIFNFQFSIFNPKYISVRDWNEAESINKILDQLQTSDVALVSDAGTPLISDPGFKIVRAARAAGISVSPIPGPNAGIAALSVSGLPTNKFVFMGFLGKKWELYPDITNIIYESPKRAKRTLQLIKDKYPSAKVVVASELTKIHEKIQDWDLEFGKWELQLGELVILVNFSRSSPTPDVVP